MARFKALKSFEDKGGPINIYGAEVSDTSRNYKWTISDSDRDLIETFYRGRIDADVSSFSIALRLVKWILANRLDVLFVPSYWPSYALVSALVARVLGLPVVVMTDSTMASGKNSYVSIMLKRVLLNLYSAAFVSGSKARNFLSHLDFNPSSVFLGYDAVDNGYFASSSRFVRLQSAPHRERLSLYGQYILSLGRFVAKKNLVALISAYADLYRRGRCNGHRLLMVGSGPLLGDLMSLAARSGLMVIERPLGVDESGDGVVEFRAFAQLKDVPVYYALATVFVLVSRNEEWGLVVNEALASSLPVILSDQVGCGADLVEDGANGLIVPPESTNAISAAIETLVGNNAVRDRMAEQAGAKIGQWGCENFSAQVTAACRYVTGRPVVII